MTLFYLAYLYVYVFFYLYKLNKKLKNIQLQFYFCHPPLQRVRKGGLNDVFISTKVCYGWNKS
ncbi:hypothetical protein AM228_22075 [Planktothricoides sp. SR001]|nr:hypothetical protein AM228_22075 [Planktothricoides sp. SR001]